MTVAEPTTTILTDSLIDRCGQRAPGYDRENRFFHEDFEELTQAGYLKLNVPKSFGGFGLSLLESCHEQRRLAPESAVPRSRRWHEPRRWPRPATCVARPPARR